jgi:uncharacterized protein YjbI with pentapeptide repeats
MPGLCVGQRWLRQSQPDEIVVERHMSAAAPTAAAEKRKLSLTGCLRADWLHAVGLLAMHGALAAVSFKVCPDTKVPAGSRLTARLTPSRRVLLGAHRFPSPGDHHEAQAPPQHTAASSPHRVNGKPVLSTEQVRAAVAKGDKSVAPLILRTGNQTSLPVRIGEVSEIMTEQPITQRQTAADARNRPVAAVRRMADRLLWGAATKRGGGQRGLAVGLLMACVAVAAPARTVNNCDISVGTLCNELNLSGAKLSGSNLALSSLKRSDLSDADLSKADLHSANLSFADLRRANLRDALMNDIDLKSADLRAADLRGAKLTDASLDGADLRGADLRGADLRGARLWGAQLNGARLDGAQLQRANLGAAQLGGASFDGADLRGAHFDDANFDGANLRGARIDASTELGRANLKGCIGCPPLTSGKPRPAR